MRMVCRAGESLFAVFFYALMVLHGLLRRLPDDVKKWSGDTRNLTIVKLLI